MTPPRLIWHERVADISLDGGYVCPGGRSNARTYEEEGEHDDDGGRIV